MLLTTLSSSQRWVRLGVSQVDMLHRRMFHYDLMSEPSKEGYSRASCLNACGPSRFYLCWRTQWQVTISQAKTQVSDSDSVNTEPLQLT